MFGTRKLGKTSAQRKAMLRQLVTDLLENGKIETTFYRAKEVQPVVEKMITLGKKAGLANYRRALSYITKEDVAKKLFDEIAPKYADRNGGYTRVTRTGPAAVTLLKWQSSSWCNPENIVIKERTNYFGTLFDCFLQEVYGIVKVVRLQSLTHCAIVILERKVQKLCL